MPKAEHHRPKSELPKQMNQKPPNPELPPFQPINPWKSAELIFTRRNLPHLEVPGATYFITFRCRSNRQLPPEARDLLMNTILRLDGRTIDLDAAVVMPDHAHTIFRVIE